MNKLTKGEQFFFGVLTAGGIATISATESHPIQTLKTVLDVADQRKQRALDQLRDLKESVKGPEGWQWPLTACQSYIDNAHHAQRQAQYIKFFWKSKIPITIGAATGALAIGGAIVLDSKRPLLGWDTLTEFSVLGAIGSLPFAAPALYANRRKLANAWYHKAEQSRCFKDTVSPPQPRLADRAKEISIRFAIDLKDTAIADAQWVGRQLEETGKPLLIVGGFALMCLAAWQTKSADPILRELGVY